MYQARDEAGGQAKLPEGQAFVREAVQWELPFQSKRMVAALLTVVARGDEDELTTVLAPHATFGRPDPRRPHARRVFAPSTRGRLLRGLRAAASRLPAHARYSNLTSFYLGVQERIRSGAEPMWSRYGDQTDALLFRFRMLDGRARIDYVGFHPQPPLESVDYSAMGPAPPMTPAIRKPDGTVLRGLPSR